MTETINKIRELRRLTLPALRRKYKQAFGVNAPPTRGKGWLWKQLAWRLQADAAESPAQRGHLSAAMKTSATKAPTRRKPDLPAPGMVITRRWRGRDLELRVLDDGFELDGVVYRTLSAAAKGATGAHWRGKLFWQLVERKRKQ